MLNILLVAGNDTNNLAKYINQQGTVNVKFAYNSLYISENGMRTEIIDVDKLVYILKDDMPYMEDMGALKRSILNNDFFTVREILFIKRIDTDEQESLKYFNEVMRVTNYDNYKISDVQEYSFAELHDVIIGTAESNKFVPNKREMIYRRERNSLGKKAYVEDSEVLTPDEFFNLLVPEFSDAVENNLRLKDVISQSDNGALIHDDREEPSPQLDNLVLPTISLPSDVRRSIVIVTGPAKSGVSVTSHLLNNSAIECQLVSVLVDATNTNGSLKIIEQNSKTGFNNIDFKQVVLSNQVPLTLGCNLISLKSDSTIGILDRINYLSMNLNKLSHDVIFIECKLDMLENIVKLLQKNIHSIAYCCDLSEIAAEELLPNILTIPEISNTILLTSNITKSYESEGVDPMFRYDSVEPKAIKKLFNDNGIDCKMVKMQPVTTLDNDSTMYENLVGIRR